MWSAITCITWLNWITGAASTTTETSKANPSSRRGSVASAGMLPIQLRAFISCERLSRSWWARLLGHGWTGWSYLARLEPAPMHLATRHQPMQRRSVWLCCHCGRLEDCGRPEEVTPATGTPATSVSTIRRLLVSTPSQPPHPSSAPAPSKPSWAGQPAETEICSSAQAWQE